MRRCFVISAGAFYGLRQAPAPGDLVIAADAGYETCVRIGLVPDLLVGDFDSMAEPKDFAARVCVPVEKDDTDTMLAVRLGLERGCERFYLYGGTGGARPDHTLANLQTLLWLRARGARGYLYDDRFVFTALQNETLTLRRTVEWGVVSVFAMGGIARGVCETGLQYPLTDAELRPDFPLGVSNHFAAETASVSVRDGALLVCWELPERS